MEQIAPIADDTALMFRLTWIQDERKQQVGLLVDVVAYGCLKTGLFSINQVGTTPTVRAIRTHSLAKGVLMGKCKTTRRTEDSTQAPNFNRCSRIVETRSVPYFLDRLLRSYFHSI